MNSLSFLSKQFDVIVSTSVPQTPASTPTGERFPQLGENEMPHPQLRRTRTWSARSFFIPTPAQSPNYNQRRTPPPTRSRKRSGSTPISARYPVGQSSVAFPPSPSSSAFPSGSPFCTSDASEIQDMRASSSQQSESVQIPKLSAIQPKLTETEHSWLQRLYFIRLLCLFMNWLWTGFSAVARSLPRHGLSTARGGKQRAEVDDDTSGDEKESDDDSIVLRSPSNRPKRPGTIRSKTSSIASIVLPPTTKPPTPSPLSKSYTPPPTVTISPSETLELRSDQGDTSWSPIVASINDNTFLHPTQHGISSTATAPALVTSGNTAGTSSPKSQRMSALHRRKTLVLDLDETLIHSTTRPYYPSATGSSGILDFGSLIGFGGKTKKAGHMVEVYMGGRSTLYHVYKRPFVDYFLRKVSTWYTLVIFTASMKEYADPVIDWLDAGRGILGLRFFREHCTLLENGAYAKDLSIINVDLGRVCLVDNSPISYSINPANGIPIEGWTQDPNDEALLDLLPVLDSLRFTSDVRHVLGLRGF